VTGHTIPSDRRCIAAWVAALVLGWPLTAVPAEPPGETLVRGFVQTGDASGVWTVRRCGDTTDVPVQDKTPGEALTVAVAEIKRTMQDARKPVFVEFQGSVAGAGVLAKRLWRVLGYVADCAEAPDNVAADAKFWASGNEPGWRLVVRGKVATFTQFGGERIAFDAATLTPQVPRRTYKAQSGGTQLTIEIDEELCLDTMAEAAYGARVTATVRNKSGSRALKGCAARF
jgi:uncharacterized membrane protein